MFRMGQEEIDAVARVINSQKFFKTTPNGETEHFEREAREYFGSPYVISMTSGWAALTAALVAMGIGPGDEVIVPAYTYIATASAVVSAGAIPVPAEVDETLMLDPDRIEEKLSSRTKAVIPVHMQGYVADMDRIMAVAKKHNLLVLEDACQCVGGKYKGKHVGTIGDAGAFSFNCFKNISAGEGGMFFTNDRDIFEKALIYHDSCAVAYFGNQLEGFTSERFCGVECRTNEIPSAILRVQLTRLNGIIADLKDKKKKFKALLAPYYNFIPENDPEGGCSTALTIQFDSPEETIEVRDKTKAMGIPANMGKHVYWAWDLMLEKRGAFHPLMNPYNFEANKGAQHFDENSCPVSNKLLHKCGNIMINPDWTDEELEARAQLFIDAATK